MTSLFWAMAAQSTLQCIAVEDPITITEGKIKDVLYNFLRVRSCHGKLIVDHYARRIRTRACMVNVKPAMGQAKDVVCKHSCHTRMATSDKTQDFIAVDRKLWVISKEGQN
jgi:hypothetical protein